MVPQSISESVRPDAAWIKKHVPILKVARALGMRIRGHRAQCWRIENHRHGDADPSVRFLEVRNRARCFVCDMRGGQSNIDLVKHVLEVNFSDAVQWIAERFTVPNIKIGRPVGSTSTAVAPYRVGVHGSEFELLVRSGMFGQLPAPARSVLIALALLRDADTGLTLLSYAGIMRYAGVGSEATVSKALKQLARLHAIEVHHGARFVGLVRECSAYRVTLNDAKFLDLCDTVSKSTREKVAEEREYRKWLRLGRMSKSRRPITQNTTQRLGGGLRPPAPPAAYTSNSNSTSKAETQRQATPDCTGQHLSSLSEVNTNKPLHGVKREIEVSDASASTRVCPKCGGTGLWVKPGGFSATFCRCSAGHELKFPKRS